MLQPPRAASHPGPGCSASSASAARPAAHAPFGPARHCEPGRAWRAELRDRIIRDRQPGGSLRLGLWAQVAVAAVAWLIMADAAFFDVYASPFSEPAALLSLLLFAVGVVDVRRGWRATVFGLVLAGSGGFLASWRRSST
jgi:hypothetical protein